MQRIGSEPHIPHDLYLKAMTSIKNAKSVEELNLVNDKFIDCRSLCVYHLPLIGARNSDHTGRYWSIGLADPIIKYLESQKNLNEPIRNYVMSKGRPFWVSQLPEEPHQWNEDETKRMNLALNNMGDGILAPAFGPFHNRSYHYISFKNPVEFYDEIFLWQMQGLLQALYVRYCLIRESLRSNIKLTPREGDVLELITFGKTNPEIGIILGISPNTVTGYVKRIFLKLEVSDRVSAALRARSYDMKY